MNFNHDEIEPPTWINRDFLKQVIQHDGGSKSVSIHDYEIAPACPLGEHFASIMFRIRITYSTETTPNQKRSIIIKTFPDADGLKKDLIDNCGTDIFANEVFMYENVLEDCVDILRRAGYTDLFVAKMLYNSKEPQKVIVFEDLKELGYVSFPKPIPNENEANKIFSKLAQFHAVTYKMNAEGRTDVERKGAGSYLHFFEKLSFSHGLPHLCEVVETWPGYEEILKKLRKITFKQLLTNCIESINKPTEYSVLNHGDIHLKNMMCKGKDTDPLLQVALVDFQVCHWASPAFDLYYISSVIPEKERKILFKVYFNTFLDVLTKSKCKGPLPTYDQLQRELKSLQVFDLLFLITHTPLLSVDRSTLKIQMDELFQNVDAIGEYYRTPEYIEFAKQALPNLFKKGALDNFIESTD